MTYHGPGQLVVYPIIDLNNFKRDLRWYVTVLEDAMADVCASRGLPTAKDFDNPGVWIPALTDATSTGLTSATQDSLSTTTSPTSVDSAPTNDIPLNKMGSVGIKIHRWVTSHGLALNVTPHVSRGYGKIVACGIHGRGVTDIHSATRMHQSLLSQQESSSNNVDINGWRSEHPLNLALFGLSHGCNTMTNQTSHDKANVGHGTDNDTTIDDCDQPIPSVLDQQTIKAVDDVATEVCMPFFL